MFLPVYFSVSAQKIQRYKINDLEKRIAGSDSVLIVNFWATWCAPCVEELSYFQTVTEKYASQQVKLLLVSMDFKEAYPGKIAAFAKKKRYKAEIVWLDETNADIFCPKIDPKWSGAIPATLVVNKKNGHRSFYDGQLSEKELDDAIGKALQ